MPSLTERRFTRAMLASPDRILVATDLADLDNLLPHAIAQAKASGARITVAHAVSPLVAASMGTTETDDDDQAKLVRDVRLILLDTIKRLQAEGIACNTSVRIGSASDLILKELERPEPTRLIMGTHGRGKLRQFALGSVAHELLSELDVPVFVVGPHTARGAHTTPRRILHPVSFIGNYQENVRLALDIAQACRAELTLLHVLEHKPTDTVNPARSMEWATQALEQFLPEPTSLSPAVHLQVVFGKVTDEILKAARQIDADWIVLSTADATQETTRETRAFAVFAEALCPVLTFRL